MEQFRIFFDLLTLCFTILKAPLLSCPYNDAFFFFQEESDTRLAVQEALSMMAPSYKNTDSTILALIEALILNYVQQVPAFYNTDNNLSLPEPII